MTTTPPPPQKENDEMPDPRRPVPLYIYRPEHHEPLDAEGLMWLADQLCSETRVHPNRTMAIGWITTQAAYELPALVDALATQADALAKVREALGEMVEHYAQLVNCGDCGNWNPEEEPVVIKARAHLQETDA